MRSSSGGAGELFLRLVLFARIDQRLAPFQVQPAPVGGVFVSFREFRQRQVRLVLRHQRLAPAFQRIGEVRAFLVGQRELRDGLIRLAARQQGLTPIGHRQREWRAHHAPLWRTSNPLCPIVSLAGDLAAHADAVVTIARRRGDQASAPAMSPVFALASASQRMQLVGDGEGDIAKVWRRHDGLFHRRFRGDDRLPVAQRGGDPQPCEGARGFVALRRRGRHLPQPVARPAAVMLARQMLRHQALQSVQVARAELIRANLILPDRIAEIAGQRRC